MATQTQYKIRGFLLMVSFFAVLVLIFMPIFPGKTGKVNGLDYLDNFFNELSKGSANYIQAERDKVAVYNGKEFAASLKLASDEDARLAANILHYHGASVSVSGKDLEVKGRDFGSVMAGMLDDADAMYKNKGEALDAKYGEDGAGGRKSFYTWYLVLAAMEKDFTKTSKFAEAKLVKGAMSKAVEPAYNYYGVEGKSVKAEMFLLIAALAFYVIYTIWYGFGLLYLFEGMGIRLDH